MEMTRIFRSALLASTSALTLLAVAPSADAQVAMNWTGMYAGVGLGWQYTSGSVKYGFDNVFDGPMTALSSSGVSGSLFGGYRYQMPGMPWVFGGELKLSVGSGSDTSASRDFGSTNVSIRNSFGMNASLMAGYALANGILPYVKLGYAGQKMKVTGQGSSVGTTFNQSKWLNGLELGIGAEIPIGAIGGAIGLPAALRLEGSYTWFGKSKVTGFSQCCSPDSADDQQIRVNPNALNIGVALSVKF